MKNNSKEKQVTVAFGKKEIEVAELVEDAYNTINTTAAENLLNEYGVKAVTLTIPGTTAKVEITAENLNKLYKK